MIYDGIGALLWAGSAVAAGRAFHRAIDRIILALENLGGWALVILALAVALFIMVKWAQRVSFYRRLRMARIHVHELKAMLDRGEKPLVLDVRSASGRERDPRRIPTAIVAREDLIDEEVEQLRPDQEIVLYCT